MSRPVSNAFKQAIFSQQTSEVFIILMTIDNDTFDVPIRVASDPFEDLPDAGVKGVVSRGNEFLYLPFTIQLPIQDDTQTAKAQISVDNISREIIAAARSAGSALKIDLEIVLASDVDNVELSVEGFKLQTLNYDAFTISGEISIDYYDLEPFPAKRFTPTDFEGLF